METRSMPRTKGRTWGRRVSALPLARTLDERAYLRLFDLFGRRNQPRACLSHERQLAFDLALQEALFDCRAEVLLLLLRGVRRCRHVRVISIAVIVGLNRGGREGGTGPGGRGTPDGRRHIREVEVLG